VNVWPAIVSVAVRAALAFAATAIVSAPEPVPLVGVTVAHAESLTAVQPHDPSLAATAAVLEPPVAATVQAVGERP
jgi:hypothetical protein